MYAYRLIRSVFFVFFLSFTAFVAQAQTYSGTPPQIPFSAPEQHINDGLNALLDIMADGQDGAALAAALEREIVPYFDFNYMADWVTGPMKRSMDAEQLGGFAGKLKAMFLKMLAAKITKTGMGQYNFQVLPARGNRLTGEVRVNVRVNRGYYQPPLILGFRLYESAAGWKIFDVLAGGRSAVMYFRHHFAQSLEPSSRPFSR